ncbi:exodeoxyribonuclease VII large subunit [Planctomicrobium sp. SH661]|uniref:exodeoxyribonuclease VII large subunit n=1 Tax=Planctomicrobium sp. SH661 TaxID=3448124 RepID=UPI003F5B396E
MIRGGGSPLDLAGMDDERLALAVANCKYPVWVGIGHEINLCVLDHIAHTSHKTPTAVAEALLSRVRQVDDRLQLASERLTETVDRRRDLAERELKLRENGLSQGTRKQLQIQAERFGRYVSHLETVLTEQAARHEGRFERSVATLRERTRSSLERAVEKLDGAEQSIQMNVEQRWVDSQKVLARAQWGLREGVRKQITWIQERLQRRVERVRASIRLQTDQKSSRLDHSRFRLQTASARQIQKTEEGLVSTRLRVPVAYQNCVLRTSENLRWRVRSLMKVILLFEQLETGLRKVRARVQFRNFDARREVADTRLLEKQRRLEAMRPEQLLKKGYTISRTTDGQVIRSTSQLAFGEEILTQVHDGTVTSRITNVESRSDD